MNNYLNHLIKLGYFPGCNCCIINDDKTKFFSCGNKCIIPNTEKNDINTIYDIASLTKVIVTNTIITKLLQENRINLSDKVIKYLPKFKYSNITIFHLLTHTSGLVSDVNWNNIKNKNDLINDLYNKELCYETGKNIVYSDIGFIFLGFIIEKIYNKSLDTVAKEEVFYPLHMDSTCFNPCNYSLCASTEVVDNKLLRGIVHDEKARLMNGVCGSAGVFSNVLDLNKFVNMILNDGIVDGKVFIKKEYIDLWFKILVSNNEVNRSIGFAISNGKHPSSKLSEETIYHYGFTGTSLVIDRRNKFGFVFLSNRVHPTRDNKLLTENRNKILDDIIDMENIFQKRLSKS